MKYKRIVVSSSGGPEVLQVAEDSLPEPSPGEVRVKVFAAGVAWGDVLKRRGLSAPKTPFTPGYDIVGIVDKAGEDVSVFEAGQMVAALPIFGGYAEYLCLPATALVPVPSGLDPAEAVCLVMNYVVAHQMLHRAARVRPGERVLIHGAGGGVGTALLQLGKLAKLEMYGTASSGKSSLVASLGGNPIDYRKESFVKRILALPGKGVDAVFDPIGGTQVWPSYRVLRRSGRLVIYGAHTIMSDGMLKTVWGFTLATILGLIPDSKQVMFYNMTLPRYSSPEWCREDLASLFTLLAQGEIKPVIAERTPLTEAVRAHQLLENASVTGKIVLVCNT